MRVNDVCCCWWLLRAAKTCCFSLIEMVDDVDDESSCESHADCQSALPGLEKIRRRSIDQRRITGCSYNANDMFLKSCSGNPVKNKVEQPPFICPLVETVTFDCCI